MLLSWNQSGISICVCCITLIVTAIGLFWTLLANKLNNIMTTYDEQIITEVAERLKQIADEFDTEIIERRLLFPVPPPAASGLDRLQTTLTLLRFVFGCGAFREGGKATCGSCWMPWRSTAILHVLCSTACYVDRCGPVC